MKRLILFLSIPLVLVLIWYFALQKPGVVESVPTAVKEHSVDLAPALSPPNLPVATNSDIAKPPPTEREVDDLTAKLSVGVHKRYSALFDRLESARLQRDRLAMWITERKRIEIAAVQKAADEGRDMNGVEVKTHANAAQVALEEKIRMEYGEAILAEYRRYEWHLSANDLVSAANAALRRSEPLTAQQVDALIGIMLKIYGTSSGTAIRLPNDPTPYRVVVSEEVLRSFSDVISPKQMEPFVGFHKMQLGLSSQSNILPSR